ncbi:MAG: hypothetical protein ACFB21_01600 [Opitutales bacterium]
MALARAQLGEGYVLIVNPLPFERTLAGVLNTGVSNPRGVLNSESTNHYQDRKDDLDPLDPMEVPEMPWKNYPDTFLRPVTVAAESHLWIKKAEPLVSNQVQEMEPSEAWENDQVRLQVDLANGGIHFLVTKADEAEWLDRNCPWRGFEWIREELEPKRHPVAARRHQPHGLGRAVNRDARQLAARLSDAPQRSQGRHQQPSCALADRAALHPMASP